MDTKHVLDILNAILKVVSDSIATLSASQTPTPDPVVETPVETPTPVEPDLPLCQKAPTLFAIHRLDETGIDFNWNGEGVAEMSVYLDQDSHNLEKFENMPMTTDRMALTWATKRPPGDYILRLVATKCRGSSASKITIVAPVVDTPSPTQTPAPTSSTPGGNVFPDLSYPDPHLYNYLPLEDIPVVKFPKNGPLNVAEEEIPYEKVIRSADKIAAIRRHATQVPYQMAIRDPNYGMTDQGQKNFQGPSQVADRGTVFLQYQDSLFPPGVLAGRKA